MKEERDEDSLSRGHRDEDGLLPRGHRDEDGLSRGHRDEDKGLNKLVHEYNRGKATRVDLHNKE